MTAASRSGTYVVWFVIEFWHSTAKITILGFDSVSLHRLRLCLKHETDDSLF